MLACGLRETQETQKVLIFWCPGGGPLVPRDEGPQGWHCWKRRCTRHVGASSLDGAEFV